MTIKFKYSPKKDDNILECFAFYSFGLTEGDNYPVEKWNNLKQIRKWSKNKGNEAARGDETGHEKYREYAVFTDFTHTGRRISL